MLGPRRFWTCYANGTSSGWALRSSSRSACSRSCRPTTDHGTSRSAFSDFFREITRILSMVACGSRKAVLLVTLIVAKVLSSWFWFATHIK